MRHYQLRMLLKTRTWIKMLWWLQKSLQSIQKITIWVVIHLQFGNLLTEMRNPWATMRHFLLIVVKPIQIFVNQKMFISESWRNQMDQKSFLKHSNLMWDWIALCDFLKKSWLLILQQETTLSILLETKVNLLMWAYNLFLVLCFPSEVSCSEMSIMSWILHIKVKY